MQSADEQSTMNELGGHMAAPYLAEVHRRWLALDPDVRWQRSSVTLVLGDISGFTRLTERLAARGKEGEEHLTDVVNGAVGRLLDTAAVHGGDLLKYGGDAVLFAFEGAGHEARAVVAASALPRALRVPRGTGTSIRLSMSIGVASGELDLFLVGTDHRELVAAGPLASAAVRLEHLAAAGEVLADERTAAAVAGARWSPSGHGDHQRLVAPPADLPTRLVTPFAAPAGDETLLAGVSAGLRRRLGIGADGEHRQVAVAFVQILAVDALLRRSGHEAVAAALDTVFTRIQDACAAHGTVFLSSDVDDGAVKCILTAGAPDASPDDADRILLTARAVATADGPLPVRAGVHLGRTFALEVGNRDRRTYTILGDAVNLAARVMGHSEPGSVVATDVTLARARTPFAVAELEPFQVKGRAAAVRASVVGPPVAGTPEARPAACPFVGRGAEQALLLSALEDTRRGTGSIHVIVGEAGIGKSRLVAEVTRAAVDVTQLHIAAGPYAAGTPYFALRTPLRRLLGLHTDAPNDDVVAALAELVGPEDAPWLPLLTPVLGVMLPDTPTTAAVEPRLRPVRTQALVTDLLDRVLPDRALLVIEDAHWLDDASTALLHHLLGALAGTPRLVLISRRDEPGGLVPHPDEATTTALGPLDAAAAEALVHQQGERLPRWIVGSLVDRGGGNPLFLEQLGASAMSGTEVEDLPATVEALIAARIDTLEPRRRRQLRVASVLGQRFPADRLCAMLVADGHGTSVPLPTFLEPDEPGWVRFQHSLVRQGAYEGLSYRSRRTLHRLAAEAIERDATDLDGQAEVLSLHWAEAHEWEPAWRWSLLAAERAAASGAPAEAARFLRRAVAASRHLPIDPAELSLVHERLHDAEKLSGHLEAAARALTQARRHVTDDPVRSAHLLGRHALLDVRAGRYRSALRWSSRGLRLLEQSPPGTDPSADGVRIELILRRSATRMRQGRLLDAVELLEQVVAEAESLGHTAALASACNGLAGCLHDLGRTEEAEHYGARSLPLFESLGDLAAQAAAHNDRGIAAYYDGDWDTAAEHWRRAADLNERAGEVAYQAMMLSNLGEIYSDRGELEPAEELFREALAVARACRYTLGIAYVLGNLGRLLTRAGRVDEAATALAAARRQAEELGAVHLVVETDVREAERRLVIGDPTGARALAEAARNAALDDDAGRLLMAGIERVAGWAAAQQRRWSSAMRHLEASLEAATGTSQADVVWAHEALEVVAQRAGRQAEAERHRAAADEGRSALGIRRSLTLALDVHA